MENIIFVLTMIPCGLLFAGLGIYAWNRKKPMWFYSGTVVAETEITDIHAYNRANGIMWILFSFAFWIPSIAGIWNETVGLILLCVGCLLGIPCLVIVYRNIYKKYKA